MTEHYELFFRRNCLYIKITLLRKGYSGKAQISPTNKDPNDHRLNHGFDGACLGLHGFLYVSERVPILSFLYSLHGRPVHNIYWDCTCRFDRASYKCWNLPPILI